MPKRGIHPLRHRVRYVLTDGSTLIIPSALKPNNRTTYFLEEDQRSDPRYTGEEVEVKVTEQISRFRQRYGFPTYGQPVQDDDEEQSS